MGTGICGFLDWTPAEQFEAERLQEAERKRLAEETKQAAEAEQYASECQRIYDELEAMFLPHLREDAAAVNATARIKPGDKKIFDEFKEYLSSWNPPLPALPAHPASVAAFLAKDLDRGTSLFTKRLCAITRLHVAAGLPDPATDVLLQSLVRKVRTLNQQQKDD